MRNRTVVITGASSGIGLETAKAPAAPPLPRPTPSRPLFGQASELDSGGGGIENAPVPPASKPPSEKRAAALWAVEPFTEKAGWLGAHQKSLGDQDQKDHGGQNRDDPPRER